LQRFMIPIGRFHAKRLRRRSPVQIVGPAHPDAR